MKFLERYWFPILLIATLLFILYNSQNKINVLEEEAKLLEKEVEGLVEMVDVNLVEIDSLKSLDPEIVKEIEYIKLEADENIKFVDTMSVSDMQGFYANRYKD